MSIERITLNFDTDDHNSMVIFNILRHIKRGHRMAVIADNILMHLDEYNLLDKYLDNPIAMAKALEMFSDIYRSSDNPFLDTSINSMSGCISKKSKRSKAEAKETGYSDCRADLNDSVKASDIIMSETKIISVNDSTSQTNQNSLHESDIKRLTEDKWIIAMNSEALSYYREQVPDSQYHEYEQALLMYGDDEDRYEELVLNPGLILNLSAPLPTDDMSFEEWLTERLHNKGIYKE